MSNQWNWIELGDLGVLRLRGADAVKFLQGQVSTDVQRLTAEHSQLAGYHNPQGRAIALLRLVQLAPDDLLAILPRDLTEAVAARLGKFVLRAKVKIAEESTGWRVAGLVAPSSGSAGRDAGGGAGSEAAEGGVGAGRGAGDVASGGLATGAAGGGTSGVAASIGVGDVAGASGVGAGTGGSQATGGSATGAAAAGATSAEAAEFEARATSWAARQFEDARARAAAEGELSLAAAQLEYSDTVVELPTASALMLPDEVNAQSQSGATVLVRVGATPARWLVISPAEQAVSLAGCERGSREAWRLLDIADGVPQVYAATSEEFVAQMLNLDALEGIAFDKGCYTGQEVIARAHYRGRVKRRLQRFLTRAPVGELAPGAWGTLADGRAFKVVEAARVADGRWEFLAVAPLGGGAEDAASGAAGRTSTAPADAVPGVVIHAEMLPVSYRLPE